MALLTVTAVYAAMFIWLAYTYLRRSDPLLRDLMWMFASVTMLFVLGLIRAVGGMSATRVVLGVFVALLLAKPVFTLRLVARLRPVPGWLTVVAVVAWAVSSLPVAVSSSAPIPQRALAPAAAVFFCLESVAAWMLGNQACRRGGAARARLWCAAAATGLFGVSVLVIAGGQHLAVQSRSLAVLSGLLYLLAFVPPHWLRRAWSTGAAYTMAQQLLTGPPDAPPAQTWQQYCDGARRVLGCDAVAVLLPDPAGGLRIFTHAGQPPLARELDDADVEELLVPPFTIDALAGWKCPPVAALALASGTRFLTATPITTSAGRGALIMLNRYRTLFADDDMSLFTELAAQAATLAQRAAALSERERLAVIVESSHDAIIGKSLDGVITSWNAGAEQLYGYTVAEAVGRDAAMLFPPGQEDSEQRLMARVAAGERVEVEHVRRRRADGRTITVALTLSPITGPAGHITGVASISRDVTASERAESMFQSLLEAAPDAMVGVTPDGTITLINAQTERLFGYRRDELLGRNVDVLVPGRPRFFAEPHPGHVTADSTLTAVRKNGTEFPAEISLSTLETDRGTIVSAAVRDVTGRLIAQAERERLIAQTERDAAERRLQAARRLESLGQLAGGVAHDFNNILAVIGNFTEMLIDTLGDDDPDLDAARADLRQISRAAERATQLTKQLLAFGRRDVTKAQTLSLNHVIGDIEQMLRRILGEDIHLITQLDRDLWNIHADPGHLEQILIILADNSRDAMPGGGTISIDTSNAELGPDDTTGGHLRPGRYVRLRISDTGSGMPPEVRDRALEPFFTTKPRGSGTGLGLATVYGLATAAGGNVHLYSEVDIGTTVTILLPAVDKPATSAGAAPAEADQPAHGTILMVEDEDALRQITARILTRAGYHVLAADGGEQAIHLAQTHTGPIDLLLTDVIMPKMTGNLVAAHVTEIRPGLPVLYMSGYAEPILTDNGTLENGVTMIEKPFTSRELLDKVREVVQRHHAHG